MSILLPLMPVVSFSQQQKRTPKTVFFIVDGIPADVLEKLNPPTLAEIAKAGGYTRAYVGGIKDAYSQTPTISAPGYIDLLTGTWGNKHNVWDNDIAAPNYNYWNIFRIAEKNNPEIKTAVFSTWLDNRTKLVGEKLSAAGAITLDYTFDGLENDTVNYPHDKNADYIRRIDEAVSTEAARVIKESGPDISWVYLEFTDDMGHRYGDSPQFYDAIKNADKQIRQVWDVLAERTAKYNEDWLIVITTDHGRDAKTGKNHGGQSDRERGTWIVTNSKNLNGHFKQTPGIVDILPSIFNHMDIAVPEAVQKELDGVPFIGRVEIADLRAKKNGVNIQLTWKNLSTVKNDKLEIYQTNTNNFREGGTDEYTKIGEVLSNKETYTFPAKDDALFYKILVKAPHHYTNVWVK